MAKKKLLSLVLILITLVSVASCGKNTNTNLSLQSATANSTATPTTEANNITDSATATATTDTPPESIVTPTPSQTGASTPTKEPIKTDDFIETNVLFQDFESATSAKAAGWYAFATGKVEILNNGGFNNSKCLKFSQASRENNTYSYSSPSFNLYSYIKRAGTYTISLKVRITGANVNNINGNGFKFAIRGGNYMDTNSFITNNGGNAYYDISPEVNGKPGDWMTLSFPLYVLASDIIGTHTWNFCLHGIDQYVTEIYIDDFKIEYAEPKPETEKLITSTETWITNEMTFIASKTAKDPLNTQTFDVEFTNGHKTIKMPGFWDGQKIWRVRFSLPSEGTWIYKTVFSDTTDSGVHNKTGKITVKKYSGNLDIYKHGFVTTQTNLRYFTYADGTPFFYLGDTHWSMFSEEFDSAGTKAGNLNASSHFKYIVDKRVQQGFTVYQSEPIEAPFNLADGLDEGDIQGLRVADKYFKYIADKGLVHANAQFFYADVMNQTIMTAYTKAQYEKLLDTLSRYWIARFGAYPVMYTLAQEVDNDFYYMRETDGNTTMTASNNPWKFVCEALYKYDPYKNPISAHQEGSYFYPIKSTSNYTTASNSAFRDVQGHTWWATQWKANLNSAFDYSALKDFWNNGQGKPIVSYEANYEGLWTNEYGARAQAYVALLNGMCGHGYGAIDIWFYNSSYDMATPTTMNGITISVETKKTPWSTSVEYAAGYQMGYMRKFFERFQWCKLTPAFDNSQIFTAQASHFSLSYINNDLYIAYIFDGIAKTGTTKTGSIKNLDKNAQYTYQWFNPRTAQMSQAQTVIKSGSTFNIGARPTAEDWVLVVQKVK